MIAPSPRGAKEAIGAVISHPHTMASTDEENDSAANTNRDFFRPLRGSVAVGYQFTHGLRHGLRSFARYAGCSATVLYFSAHAPRCCPQGAGQTRGPPLGRVGLFRRQFL
jgi:hypothetical protein